MATTLILFLLINGYFIVSFTFFRMGLNCSSGAVEISPRALVVLKPSLPIKPVENVVITKKGIQDRNNLLLDGRTVENKGKLILTKGKLIVSGHETCSRLVGPSTNCCALTGNITIY